MMPGSHPLAARRRSGRAGGDRPCPARRPPGRVPSASTDRAVVDPPALAVEDGGAGDRGRHARIGAGRSTDRDRGGSKLRPAPSEAVSGGSRLALAQAERSEAATAAAAISLALHQERASPGLVLLGMDARRPAARRARSDRPARDRDVVAACRVHQPLDRRARPATTPTPIADRDPADRRIDVEHRSPCLAALAAMAAGRRGDQAGDEIAGRGERNQVPMIRLAMCAGASRFIADRPTGDRQSSPVVWRR